MSHFTTIKQNDTRPAFTATLRDGLGNAINLTGCSLRFAMRNRRTREVKVDAVATVESAAAGTMSYQWVTGDTDTAGVYDVEIQATFGDGTVASFPNSDHHELRVIDDLA